MTEPPTLIICRGLPASGKTTFAREWVAEDPSSRARVNKDDLRRLMHDGVYRGHDTERQVNVARDTMIEQLLRAGISVVNDDTNLPQPVARELAKIGRRTHPEITITVKDFTDVPVEVCVERDFGRTEGILNKSVGPEVIYGMHNRYLTGKTFPLPWPETDTDRVAAPTLYAPDLSLRQAWLVDLDGTLARMNGRGPFEWHRVGEDDLNGTVLMVVNALAEMDYEIVVMSGRDEVCRPETEKWLLDHHVPWERLFMRPAGDTRKDAIVKRELLDEVAKTYQVVGSLDDRDQVVEMWRAVGIPCFQVAPGAF